MSAPRRLYRLADPTDERCYVEMLIPADQPDQVECLVHEADACLGASLGSPAVWRAACLRMAQALAGDP